MLWCGEVCHDSCEVGGLRTDACWVCDALFEAVGTEGAEHYAGGAVEAADCPEGRHCWESWVVLGWRWKVTSGRGVIGEWWGAWSYDARCAEF